MCCGSFIGIHRPEQNKWTSSYSLSRLVASFKHQLLTSIRGEQLSEKMTGESVVLCVADTLLPVCSSVYGSSGGLAGAQRACLKTRLWVLLIGLTLKWPELCVTHTPTNQTNHKNRALFRLAAELWPS